MIVASDSTAIPGRTDSPGLRPEHGRRQMGFFLSFR